MEKIKVLVGGYNGHMGQIVCDLIKKSSNMQLVAGFDKAMREFSEIPVFETIQDLQDSYSEDDAFKVDVIIDFSSPKCAMTLLYFANKYHIPMVIATTGFSQEQHQRIFQYSEKLPIFGSANMSYEVSLLKKVLQEISPKLAGCDIEISEIHHNRKADAPSGTAKMFADAINESLDNSMQIVYGRTGKRETNQIGVTSLRGGNIVGTHSIFFFGENETLEIKHTALSRNLFAEGALKAAEFIISKDFGMYNMDDLM